MGETRESIEHMVFLFSFLPLTFNRAKERKDVFFSFANDPFHLTPPPPGSSFSLPFAISSLYQHINGQKVREGEKDVREAGERGWCNTLTLTFPFHVSSISQTIHSIGDLLLFLSQHTAVALKEIDRPRLCRSLPLFANLYSNAPLKETDLRIQLSPFASFFFFF